MNKAVLIMDMPECCSDCKFWDWEDDICDSDSCYAMGGSSIDDIGERPDWCPLKKLPDRDPEGDNGAGYQLGQPLTEEFAYRLIAYGYNECIDEILAGVDNNNE